MCLLLAILLGRQYNSTQVSIYSVLSKIPIPCTLAQHQSWRLVISSTLLDYYYSKSRVIKERIDAKYSSLSTKTAKFASQSLGVSITNSSSTPISQFKPVDGNTRRRTLNPFVLLPRVPIHLVTDKAIMTETCTKRNAPEPINVSKDSTISGYNQGDDIEALNILSALSPDDVHSTSSIPTVHVPTIIDLMRQPRTLQIPKRAQRKTPLAMQKGSNATLIEMGFSVVTKPKKSTQPSIPESAVSDAVNEAVLTSKVMDTTDELISLQRDIIDRSEMIPTPAIDHATEPVCPAQKNDGDVSFHGILEEVIKMQYIYRYHTLNSFNLRSLLCVQDYRLMRAKVTKHP